MAGSCGSGTAHTSSSAPPSTKPAPPPGGAGFRLDDATGEQIRRRSLDTTSAGTQRQNQLRDPADADGYAEPSLWTGIGRARSGASAAIVRDPAQVLAKIRGYASLGIESFILSGYPHAAEGDLFARHVLPHLDYAQPDKPLTLWLCASHNRSKCHIAILPVMPKKACSVEVL